MRFPLLKCLAKAMAKHGVKFLFNLVPGGEVVYEIAADALKDYLKERSEGDLGAEIEVLAETPAEQVRQEAKAVVQAEAANLSAKDQQAMIDYLTRARTGPGTAKTPNPPEDGLVAADTLTGNDLPAHVTSEVRARFTALVERICQICPGCLAKCRGDGAWIFVPPERRMSTKNKNLITVWPRKSSMQLRIMPAPQEPFDPAKMSFYEGRLNMLHVALVALGV